MSGVIQPVTQLGFPLPSLVRPVSLPHFFPRFIYQHFQFVFRHPAFIELLPNGRKDLIYSWCLDPLSIVRSHSLHVFVLHGYLVVANSTAERASLNPQPFRPNSLAFDADEPQLL